METTKMVSTKNWVEIDTIRIAEPTKINVEVHRINYLPRNFITGELLMDTTVIQRVITLKYDFIAAPELEAISNLLESKDYHELHYPDPQNGGSRITEVSTGANVGVGGITVGIRHTTGTITYWQSVQIRLFERTKHYVI